MTFLVSCAAGFESIVSELLRRDFGSTLTALTEEEGMVVFDGQFNETALKQLTYVNNAFVVLTRLRAATGVDSLLSQLLSNREWLRALRLAVGRNRRTFRFMLSDENRLVSGSRTLLAEIIRSVETAAGLSYRPRGGDTELWVIRRRSGAAFLSMRLSRRSGGERVLERGELRPELSELLCQMSEPLRTDIVMDPFAGSGSIVLARRIHPYNMIFSFDSSDDNIVRLKRRLREGEGKSKRRAGPVIVRREDALTLKSIEDGFIDKIITDPPWGSYDRSIDDIQSFYRQAISQMIRVTKVGGVIILLVGRTECLERAATESRSELSLEQRLDILVSGKKAMVLKWRRQSTTLVEGSRQI